MLSDWVSTHMQVYPLSRYHSKRRGGWHVTPILKIQRRTPISSLIEVIWSTACFKILPVVGFPLVAKHFISNPDLKIRSDSESSVGGPWVEEPPNSDETSFT